MESKNTMKICKIGWRHPARYLLPAAFATALMAPMAQAAVIDFNHLIGTSLVDRGLTYTEDGFELNVVGLGVFTSIHSRNFRFAGTVSFLNNIGNSVTRLTQRGLETRKSARKEGLEHKRHNTAECDARHPLDSVQGAAHFDETRPQFDDLRHHFIFFLKGV